jgi:hydrogenase maturation protease
MSIERVKDIADAVLFEGYILYPYRPSAIKNQQRWTFGGVFPRAFEHDEPSLMQTEILLNVQPTAEVDVILRFLQTQRRQIVNADRQQVAALEKNGKQYVAWDEAVVRDVTFPRLSISALAKGPQSLPLFIPAAHSVEQLPDAAGEVIRSAEALTGLAELSVQLMQGAVARIRVAIENTTPIYSELSRAEAQRYAFLSTHTILIARDAEFISLIDPPATLAKTAATCDNRGTWPVLAGEEPARDIVLSSPIILYDYPKVAPESKNQFFDATEIDEMLTLRVLTLTDDEQREMAATDPCTRDILDRCRSLSREQLYELHGALRDPSPRGGALAVGTHVRLNPKRRGDIFDIALKDKVAVVQAIERDLEDRLHVAVTLLDDPGGDLGARGFPGHRFFFSLEEVEALETGVAP